MGRSVGCNASTAASPLPGGPDGLGLLGLRVSGLVRVFGFIWFHHRVYMVSWTFHGVFPFPGFRASLGLGGIP